MVRIRVWAALCSLVLLILDVLFILPISQMLAIGGVVFSVVASAALEKYLLKRHHKKP